MSSSLATCLQILMQEDSTARVGAFRNMTVAQLASLRMDLDTAMQGSSTAAPPSTAPPAEAPQASQAHDAWDDAAPGYAPTYTAPHGKGGRKGWNYHDYDQARHRQEQEQSWADLQDEEEHRRDLWNQLEHEVQQRREHTAAWGTARPAGWGSPPPAPHRFPPPPADRFPRPAPQDPFYGNPPRNAQFMEASEKVRTEIRWVHGNDGAASRIALHRGKKYLVFVTLLTLVCLALARHSLAPQFLRAVSHCGWGTRRWAEQAALRKAAPTQLSPESPEPASQCIVLDEEADLVEQAALQREESSESLAASSVSSVDSEGTPFVKVPAMTGVRYACNGAWGKWHALRADSMNECPRTACGLKLGIAAQFSDLPQGVFCRRKACVDMHRAASE
ncbi:unnamed protein product [Symbiodinium sp. CCMP2592]|nr:unnamed protein product [Symbiodinium sp. CCMP2592]